MFLKEYSAAFFPQQLNKRKRSLIIISILLAFLKFGYTQYKVEPISFTKNFNWKVSKHTSIDNKKEELIFFDGASYLPKNPVIPVLCITKKLPLGSTNFKIVITEALYEDVQSNDVTLLKNTETFNKEISIISNISFSRNIPFAVIQVIPFKKEPSTKSIKKLTKLTLQISPTVNFSQRPKRPIRKSNSSLSTGDWYRMSVTTDGVYKITYNFMKELGIDVDAINPQNINIYGNGAGMLPEDNSVYRHDDLKINNIFIKGEEDGSFDSGDYILFFAKGPNKWTYDSIRNNFVHSKHLYSNVSNYFVGIGASPRKRITNASLTTGVPNYVTNSFDDYQFHELDKTNLISSGREWYGEEFNIINTQEFSFNFPNTVLDSSVYLKTYILGRTIGTQNYSDVEVSVNGTPSKSQFKIFGVPEGYLADKGRPGVDLFNFKPLSNNIVTSIRFNKFTPNSQAWLNYLELNVRRKLQMAGNQMLFRDRYSIGQSKITKFQLSNSDQIAEIWDVTDPTQAKRIPFTSVLNSTEFIAATDTLKEFICFNGSNFLVPKVEGKTPNQNLHGLYNIDLMIVTHSLFINQANELAQFHKNEGLTTHVATNQQVYNEFSSGTPDITAIKDLMRMLYNKAGTDSLAIPKYLLLFGDGSFDNKNIMEGESNSFILTYQSPNSYSLLESFVSDDYFGFLDPNESSKSFDIVDIGIGRLPVRTVEEAQTMISKIKHYSRTGSASNIKDPLFKDWRNIICLIADDGDSNRHFGDAEELAKVIREKNPQFNVKKIYLDSYQQESTAVGEKYPDVNREINDIVKKGALIINYTGHGGELGWAHEQILDNPTILSWENFDNMPLFFTATCEFSRYDDPKRTAAGEYVLLNPKGGGIALMTTTRLVFASPNAELNRNFFLTALDQTKNKDLRLGDLNRITKSASAGTGQNRRNFSLLGDPALKLNFPKKKVITSTLNGKPIDQNTDTLKALSKVTITGYVADEFRNKNSKFQWNCIPYCL